MNAGIKPGARALGRQALPSRHPSTAFENDSATEVEAGAAASVRPTQSKSVLQMLYFEVWQSTGPNNLNTKTVD